MIPNQEPPVDAPPVRRFLDPAYRPQAATLGELRAKIDAIDSQVVELLASRALCVRDATRFKGDEFAVAAPARQTAVFARVRELATPHADAFPGLADVVESTYRALVAGFVAAEGRLFSETEPVTP
jgi:isochorismate pyruvate lyase